MTVKDIYESVSRRLNSAPDDRAYLTYLWNTLLELRVMIEQKYLWLNGLEPPPAELTPDEVWCNSLFHPCITENILYLFTGDERYKSEFIRLANAAEEAAKKAEAGQGVIMRKYAW